MTPLLQLPYHDYLAQEIDQADSLVFLVAKDALGSAHLLTFSPSTRKLISDVACPICKAAKSLSFL